MISECLMSFFYLFGAIFKTVTDICRNISVCLCNGPSSFVSQQKYYCCLRDGKNRGESGKVQRFFSLRSENSRFIDNRRLECGSNVWIERTSNVVKEEADRWLTPNLKLSINIHAMFAAILSCRSRFLKKKRPKNCEVFAITFSVSLGEFSADANINRLISSLA